MHALLSWPKVNQLTPIEIERRQNKNYGLKWTGDNWQLAYIVYGTFGNSSWHFCSIELSLKLIFTVIVRRRDLFGRLLFVIQLNANFHFIHGEYTYIGTYIIGTSCDRRFY